MPEAYPLHLGSLPGHTFFHVTAAALLPVNGRHAHKANTLPVINETNGNLWRSELSLGTIMNGTKFMSCCDVDGQGHGPELSSLI